MRVLLLTQVLPFPPDSGPKAKTWQLIKWLAAEGHEITLASFVRGEGEPERAALRRYCRAVHGVEMRRGRLRDAAFLLASVAADEPFLMRRDHRAAMQSLVRRLARDQSFDVVHADQLNMAQYARLAPGAAMVLDAHNALWLLYGRLAATMPRGVRRALLTREARLLRRYEGAMGRAADAVLAVSEGDRAALAEVIGNAQPITVVPIAIDPNETPALARRADASRIAHVGTMYWPPNADAVRWLLAEIYPRIRTAQPDVGVDIIGARPPRDLIAAARTDPHLQVTGYVPDPTPYLESAAVFVVPLRAGSGMRVKILTALAHALPVVTTTLGCEGIAAESGTHLLVADSAEEFAAATLRILRDRPFADALGHNGRRLIETRYDYRHVYAALRPIYDRADRAGAVRQWA